jgi:hypothetical protein
LTQKKKGVLEKVNVALKASEQTFEFYGFDYLCVQLAEHSSEVTGDCVCWWDLKRPGSLPSLDLLVSGRNSFSQYDKQKDPRA